MKVLVLNGSSKADSGNTQKILSMVQNWMPGASFQFFHVAKTPVRPCLDCRACFTTGSCVIRDDMEAILSAIEDSDLIILASPIYTNFISGALKLVLDRLRPMQSGKYTLNCHQKLCPITKVQKAFRFLLVSTCGFPEISTFDSLKKWYAQFIDEYDNFQNLGEIYVPAASFIASDETRLSTLGESIREGLISMQKNKAFIINKEWICQEDYIGAMKKIGIFSGS